jgi:hypothetical protein
MCRMPGCCVHGRSRPPRWRRPHRRGLRGGVPTCSARCLRTAVWPSGCTSWAPPRGPYPPGSHRPGAGRRHRQGRTRPCHAGAGHLDRPPDPGRARRGTRRRPDRALARCSEHRMKARVSAAPRHLGAGARPGRAAGQRAAPSTVASGARATYQVVQATSMAGRPPSWPPAATTADRRAALCRVEVDGWLIGPNRRARSGL